MAAWGQTIEQLRHWMHVAGFHTGMWVAMLRFSHCVVAVGQVPSSGIMETGMSLPRWAMSSAVTFWTNSGASGETVGGIL